MHAKQCWVSNSPVLAARIRRFSSDYHPLGSIKAVNAQLDQAGIFFRIRSTMPFPQPVPSTTLLISGLKAQPRGISVLLYNDPLFLLKTRQGNALRETKTEQES